MNIHEYQGKEILKSFGVRVQEGIVAETPEQAVEAAKRMKEEFNSDWVVVKAQSMRVAVVKVVCKIS
ncbi:Succinyl-CoA ligase [ADP-forming] subunit beta [Sphingobacterium daejeonense]|nr:Succinyl-CoA ligase [ADP-forming] subunit beta [Sphingobacterium daejeonense]